MHTKWSTYLTNVIIALVSLSLSLVAAETGFRYYKYKIAPDSTSGMVVVNYERGPHSQGEYYSFADNLAFQFKADDAYNNWAFRFPQDYSDDKQPGEYRIAVLGDSYTENITNDFSWVSVFAHAVEQDQVLKNALGVRRITVANFANSSSGVIFMATQLEQIRKLYKPDLAIFAFIDEDLNRMNDGRSSIHWRTIVPKNHAFSSVNEVIDAVSPPKHNLMSVTGAPGFKLELLGNGVSRMVYCDEKGDGFISDKTTLSIVHDAMVKQRVYSGRILIWDEVKKIIAPYFTDPVEQETEARKEYYAAFEKAVEIGRASAPHVLFVNLPAFYEIVDQWSRTKPPRSFVYWPDFFQRRSDVPLISLYDHLPKAASYEQRYGWFDLPWDGHPSNAGAELYGTVTADLVTRYLEGDKTVTVTPDTVAREMHRYTQYIQREENEEQSLTLLLKSREAAKAKKLDEAIRLISAAIDKSDDVGAPGVIYLERANMWMGKGNAAKAFDDLTKALAKDTHPAFLETRIQAALQLKNQDAVTHDLHTLEAVGKNDPAIQQFIAQIKTQQTAGN